MSKINEVALVVAHIERVVGSLDGAEAPMGWRGQVNCALIDAVFSARARYGTAETGVRRVVKRWTDKHPPDDLRVLAAYADTSADLETLLGNRQRVPGGSTTKAAAVAHAAARLVDVGVVAAADVLDDDGVAFAQIKSVVTGVPGIGDVTFTYFGMLLGRVDVKADLHIRRFVTAALAAPDGSSSDSVVSSERARSLLNDAARVMDVDPITLDHAVWRAQRGPAQY